MVLSVVLSVSIDRDTETAVLVLYDVVEIVSVMVDSERYVDIK